jgi:hypothetical protein
MDLMKPETFHALAYVPAEGKLREVTCLALVELFGMASDEEADPMDLLHAIARVLAPLGASGVEHCPAPPGGPHDGGFDYVNLGDTYRTTVLLETDGETFSVGSWGGYYESLEEAHEEESGETRCAYCGEWSEEPCHREDGTPRKKGEQDEEEEPGPHAFEASDNWADLCNKCGETEASH